MGELILFDIDGTLFDAQKFGQKIRAEFIKILNTEEEELIRVNADYYATLSATTDFNPREIVAYISGRFGVAREDLDNVFWESETIYKECFFQEAEDVLKKLSKNHTLGIFSQGNEELQRRKLSAGGFIKYFKEEYIFIHLRKMSDDAIALVPRAATVIDDNHDVAVKLSSFTDSIWMNRRSEDSDPSVKTIHSLSDLLI